jgi:stage V sporulation protein D (sporulation-specific penicillin-binding protein)
VLIIFLFTAIFAKLIYLQIFSGENLQVLALDQWSRDVPVKGERGDIYDVNGVLLADTATTYTIYVRPNSVSDKAYDAQILSSVLGLDEVTVYNKINSKVSEVTLSKKVTSSQISLIYSSNVSGVYYSQNIERKYIYGDYLSMVLGFTNIDGEGQTGIEAYYNQYLKGVDGAVLTETDLVGRELDDNVTYYIAGQKGDNVYLTIDYAIQNFVQNAVNDAYVNNNALASSCIVLTRENRSGACHGAGSVVRLE